MSVRTHANGHHADGSSVAGTVADARADVQALAHLAASGGCAMTDMRLVRWRNLRTVFGARWPKVESSVVDTLRREIMARVANESAPVRYDDASFLVVCPGRGAAALHRLDSEFIETIGTLLVGVLKSPDLIEVLTPISVGEAGFEVAPPIPAPGPGTTTAVGEDGGGAGRKLVLGDAAFRYYPIWDIGEDAVFCYLFEAFWDIGTGDAVPVETLTGQFQDPKQLLALDLETLSKAVEELDKRLNQYRLAKVLVPVHYRTLADPATRETYVRFCNGKMWSVHEFALFELTNPPADVTHAELADAVRQIEPFGSGVMLRVAPGFSRFDRVPADRILAIGIDVRPDVRPETEIIADLKTLGVMAGRLGVKSFVHGLHTLSPSVIAACAGIDLIGSDAIAQAVEDWQEDPAANSAARLLKSLLARSKMRKNAG